jgi:hypothetical protein
MTIQWKAEGIGDIGAGNDRYALRIGTRLTEGFASALGKHITVGVDDHGLAFLLSYIGNAYPEAIRALARELGDYEPLPPGHYDRHDYPRSSRLRSAITGGLRKYRPEKREDA